MGYTMNIAAIILIIVGLISLSGGVFAWPWFMNSRRARSLTSIIGYTGARIFYVILGVGVLIYGITIIPGPID